MPFIHANNGSVLMISKKGNILFDQIDTDSHSAAIFTSGYGSVPLIMVAGADFASIPKNGIAPDIFNASGAGGNITFPKGVILAGFKREIQSGSTAYAVFTGKLNRDENAIFQAYEYNPESDSSSLINVGLTVFKLGHFSPVKVILIICFTYKYIR